MSTLFISDLHLDPARPAVTALLLDFLQRRGRQTEALYILGDLFETWIGDDDDAELGQTVAQALRALADCKIPVYFLHGNRDFLLGERFASAAGAQLLPESLIIELSGERVLLLHGDTLCTDDVEYQAFRAQVRTPAWRERTLALPLTQRRALAGQLREASRQAALQKTLDITDVNQAEVDRVMRAHSVDRLIHGHTHRPALHDWTLDGRPARRAVLGDWYKRGCVLCCDAAGWRLEFLPLPGT